jgi:hypothetical protein
MLVGATENLSSNASVDIEELLKLPSTTIHEVNTLSDFNNYIIKNFANFTPGGVFFNDAGTPAFAYQLDGGIYPAIFMQNVLDNILSNTSIVTQYATFNIPWTVSLSRLVEKTALTWIYLAGFHKSTSSNHLLRTRSCLLSWLLRGLSSHRAGKQSAPASILERCQTAVSLVRCITRTFFTYV